MNKYMISIECVHVLNINHIIGWWKYTKVLSLFLILKLQIKVEVFTVYNLITVTTRQILFFMFEPASCQKDLI